MGDNVSLSVVEFRVVGEEVRAVVDGEMVKLNVGVNVGEVVFSV